MKRGDKFSKETQNAKFNIRLLRLQAGYSVNEGAKKLGLSNKQLEDIESNRNYGCYLNLDTLVKIANLYDVSLDGLVFGKGVVKIGDQSNSS